MLPNDILNIMCSYLFTDDILKIKKISKYFNNFVYNNLVLNKYISTYFDRKLISKQINNLNYLKIMVYVNKHFLDNIIIKTFKNKIKISLENNKYNGFENKNEFRYLTIKYKRKDNIVIIEFSNIRNVYGNYYYNDNGNPYRDFRNSENILDY